MGLITNENRQKKIVHFLVDVGVEDTETPFPVGFFMSIEPDVLPRLRGPLGDGRAELLDELPSGAQLRGHIDRSVFRFGKRPEPAAPAQASRQQIIKRVFGGDAEAFEQAQRYGFPKPSGSVVTFKDFATLREPFWFEDAIQRWAKGLGGTAAAIADYEVWP